MAAAAAQNVSIELPGSPTGAAAPETVGTPAQVRQFPDGSFERIITLTKEPRRGLGMSLALSTPKPFEPNARLEPGMKVQVRKVAYSKIKVDGDDVRFAKRGAVVLGLVLGVGATEGTYKVKLTRNRAQPEETEHDLTLDEIEQPGVVFVNRFQRRRDGTQSEAKVGNQIIRYDQLVAVNGKRALDLYSLVEYIRDSGEQLKLTFLRSAKLEELFQQRLLSDQRAHEIELTLRQIFDGIKTHIDQAAADGSRVESKQGAHADDMVTLEQVYAAGVDVYRKAGIILPNLPMKDMPIFRELDSNGDGRISWTEFKDVLLVRLAGECHATRQAHYANVWEELDQDDNGRLSRDEIEAAISKPTSLFHTYFPFVSKEMLSHFNVADQDNDGSLTYDEFRDAMEDFWLQRQHPETVLHVDRSGAPLLTFEQAKKVSEDLRSQEQRAPVTPHAIDVLVTHAALGVDPLSSGELGHTDVEAVKAEVQAHQEALDDKILRMSNVFSLLDDIHHDIEELSEQKEDLEAHAEAKIMSAQMTKEMAQKRHEETVLARAASLAKLEAAREREEEEAQRAHRAEVARQDEERQRKKMEEERKAADGGASKKTTKKAAQAPAAASGGSSGGSNGEPEAPAEAGCGKCVVS